jgi:hypothetical protein
MQKEIKDMKAFALVTSKNLEFLKYKYEDSEAKLKTY